MKKISLICMLLIGSIISLAQETDLFPPSLQQQRQATLARQMLYGDSSRGKSTAALPPCEDIIGRVSGFPDRTLRSYNALNGGGRAKNASLELPCFPAWRNKDQLVICDPLHDVVVTYFPSTGLLKRIAGTGIHGFSGDGGPALEAQLYCPEGLAFDPSGNMYIADGLNHRIRRVDTNGIITTIAGTDSAGYSGDGGPANLARLSATAGGYADSQKYYFCDAENNVIRAIFLGTGIIGTVVGNGLYGVTEDGGLATKSALSNPISVCKDTLGNIYFAEHWSNSFRVVTKEGKLFTLAGTLGYAGDTGDGGLATQARFLEPSEARVGFYLGVYGVYLVDYAAGTSRFVALSNFKVYHILGGGLGYQGDGEPANQVRNRATSIIPGQKSGEFYLCDYSNDQIRRVATENDWADDTLRNPLQVTDSPYYWEALPLVLDGIKIRDAVSAGKGNTFYGVVEYPQKGYPSPYLGLVYYDGTKLNRIFDSFGTRQIPLWCTPEGKLYAVSNLDYQEPQCWIYDPARGWRMLADSANGAFPDIGLATNIAVDNRGQVFVSGVFISKPLYCYRGNKWRQVPWRPLHAKETITSMTVDEFGAIYASGTLVSDSPWHSVVYIHNSKDDTNRKMLDISGVNRWQHEVYQLTIQDGHLYGISARGVLDITGDKILAPYPGDPNNQQFVTLSICQSKDKLYACGNLSHNGKISLLEYSPKGTWKPVGDLVADRLIDKVLVLDTTLSVVANGTILQYHYKPPAPVPEITKVSVWPNPTKDFIQVEYPSDRNGDYVFTDIVGRKIQAGHCDSGDKIDLRMLASGMYFLDVASTVWKIIKL